MVKNFRFDQSFIGVVGVDLDENEVTTYMANEGMLKTLVLENSKQTYMLCENAKLNQQGNYKFAKVSDFTGCILEGPISQERKKQFKEEQVNVLY